MKDVDDESFKGTFSFLQEKVLKKIDTANFGPGGDDDEAYRADFFEGKTAMLFNGVWDAGGSVDCGAGAQNIRPAVFPTDKEGEKAALLSGGCGLVVSSQLDEAQTEAAVEFIKYLTSPEIAERIIAKGIGMAPGTDINYDGLLTTVETPEGKLLVEACQLCQSADIQALGLGNTFGDLEGEIQAKYAGLKDGSKTVDDVITELNDFLKSGE
ncbi:ABC-type glycerol-3-phosphate transport system substrate-binding protein [Lachnospiraceae bacterium PM6-15]|uniref:Extracellular solute-binding protein n=1 Tax=Ohessyouella blattaphilus TaxID=2949333 RepID=A0ABT1EH18_9FIRM|nr:extracellular solute-binding protein [Ohessyouella blattaphilus]MCP1109983.1 extracellular solute-binding protein [Ohessyouella blattaphilus]MCR8563377.1 extracellular solute-binding protein [Ohessyouella blattaphilus]